jgi:hypothetical protein
MSDSVGMAVLVISALVVLLLIIIVIESAALQFIGWGNLRRSLRGALFMNLASALFTFIFLALVPRLGWPGLLGGAIISVLIEGLILRRMKPDGGSSNWTAAIIANLTSYIILILPVDLYSR